MDEREMTLGAWRLAPGLVMDQVNAGGRVVLVKHGRPHAALISLAQLEDLRALEGIKAATGRDRLDKLRAAGLLP